LPASATIQGALTDTFLNALFEHCALYDGKMDFRAYLDFVLAMENKSDAASVTYFMRIVCTTNTLDARTIAHYFNEIRVRGIWPCARLSCRYLSRTLKA
jgi:serine/threonine-protein phosphatase 2A regulatory subunit B''